MTLLPYEPPLFEKYGLTCTFVGHPVIENTANLPTDISFLRTHTSASLSEHVEIPENARILCVLPGSRHSEISRLAPVFVESIKRVHKEIPNLFLLIPAVETMKDEVEKHFANLGIPYQLIVGQQPRYEAFRMSEFALAASGTVSLELSACGTPHLIAYTFSKITNKMAEFLVKVKFANLINILANRRIIPEFVLRNCDAKLIAPEALSFLQDKEKGEIQMMQAKEQLAKLKPADMMPSEKAAEVVLEMISGKNDVLE
jgi:lipid-A-disaccharide synthase